MTPASPSFSNSASDWPSSARITSAPSWAGVIPPSGLAAWLDNPQAIQGAADGAVAARSFASYTQGPVHDRVVRSSCLAMMTFWISLVPS